MLNASSEGVARRFVRRPQVTSTIKVQPWHSSPEGSYRATAYDAAAGHGALEQHEASGIGGAFEKNCAVEQPSALAKHNALETRQAQQKHKALEKHRVPGNHPGSENDTAPAPYGVTSVSRPGREACASGSSASERGSATVEFVFLSLLVLIPVLYFVLTVTRIQAAGFAVTGAADQASRLAVHSKDDRSARPAMDRAVELALADQDLPAGTAQLTVTCQPADCRRPGTAVTVEVAVDVQLPFTPPGLGLDVAHLAASGTQIVGRFG